MVVFGEAIAVNWARRKLNVSGLKKVMVRRKQKQLRGRGGEDKAQS